MMSSLEMVETTTLPCAVCLNPLWVGLPLFISPLCVTSPRRHGVHGGGGQEQRLGFSPTGARSWNNTGCVCVFVHVWTSVLGVFCFYKDVKLFWGGGVVWFFSTFGFIESSEVLLATCSLLNNFCVSSDFISFPSISYLFEVVVPHLHQCPTHVSGRALN